MVAIEDIKDASAQENDYDYETEYDSDDNGSDVISISSVDDDQVDDAAAIANETIQDRLFALRDMVPPSVRLDAVRKYTRAREWVVKGGLWAGNAVWVVTTSALLVGLPLALAIEDEARIVQQEKELQGQQSGQQAVGLEMEFIL